MTEQFDSERAGWLIDSATAAAGEFLPDSEDLLDGLEAEIFGAALFGDDAALERLAEETERARRVFWRLSALWDQATEARRGRNMARLQETTGAIRRMSHGEFQRKEECS